MFFLWGSSNSTVTVESGEFYCPHCSAFAPYHIDQVQQQSHLYFISVGSAARGGRGRSDPHPFACRPAAGIVALAPLGARFAAARCVAQARPGSRQQDRLNMVRYSFVVLAGLVAAGPAAAASWADRLFD